MGVTEVRHTCGMFVEARYFGHISYTRKYIYCILLCGVRFRDSHPSDIVPCKELDK